LDGRILRGLRRLAPEIDFRTAHDAELEGLSDPEVLQVVAESDRILISQDRGTMPRHFREFIRDHESPGVILLREGIAIAGAIEELMPIALFTYADRIR
jgi:hypothetical protein